MSSITELCVCVIFSFLSLEMVVNGMLTVNLNPSDVQVNIGEWANFSCSMSCNLTLTNTMNWFVGDSPSSRRRVDTNFEQRTGFLIKQVEVSGCTGSTAEMLTRELYIFASSVEKLNKTAVQCGATKKKPSIPDIFSHYSMMIVKDEREVTTTTTTTEEVTTTEPPSPSKTEPVTITATKTVTVTVTLSAQATNCPKSKCSGALRRVSSLLLTVFLISLSFSIH